MTLKQLFTIKDCPNLRYAMAYWLHNNHNVSTKAGTGGVSLYRFLNEHVILANYLKIIMDWADFTTFELADTIYELESDGSD